MPTQMSLSLRKSCHACIQAKRRCLPQLPACERCCKRKIICKYDLEPVTQSQSSESTSSGNSLGRTPEESSKHAEVPINMVYNSVKTARDASSAAIGRGMSSTSTAARPLLTTDGELVDWLMTFFAQVARDGLASKASPFVHACIFRHELPSNWQTLEVATCDAQTQTMWKERTALEIRLSEIHNLITLALQRLLLEKSSNKKDLEVEALVTRLFSSTNSLWSSAPASMNDVFSPWEAWIIAESIRRSMFAGIFIRGLWMAAVHGHCQYEPFFESIPFDPRSGLWEAITEREWEERKNRHGNEHTRLKSYHEFITDTGGKSKPEEDGSFQRLLFACYYGPQGIQTLEDLDRQYKKRPELRWNWI